MELDLHSFWAPESKREGARIKEGEENYLDIEERGSRKGKEGRAGEKEQQTRKQGGMETEGKREGVAKMDGERAIREGAWIEMAV
jgi:hypothetical protein